mmetsp:Transcript_11810/g.27863  ORF Transcript_11810/g.27863 Transcript_11810/m.27863 type:complete len:81 (+) Transcript_11810:252-494(+)
MHYGLWSSPESGRKGCPAKTGVSSYRSIFIFVSQKQRHQATRGTWGAAQRSKGSRRCLLLVKVIIFDVNVQEGVLDFELV